MNYLGYEEDDLPRPVAPSVPREEILVPSFDVPDVSIVVEKASARRQKSSYQEWQKNANLVFLEGTSGGSCPRRTPEVPALPLETSQPIIEKRSPMERPKIEPTSVARVSGQDEVIRKLETLLASYSMTLEEQIDRLSVPKEPAKPSTADKGVSAAPRQKSIGIQCDLLRPEVVPDTKSCSSQTDPQLEVFDNRRASDSCLQGGLFARNPGQSDAWSTEMSLATHQYMEKYNLLGESRSPGTRNVLEGIKGPRWQQKFH